MAGNAKVGNRVNLWTRWQALEYITSQNFERRALNTLERGQRGARRDRRVAHRRRARMPAATTIDTVAEDADLTMALAASRLQGELRRPRARLHRSAHDARTA